MYKGKREKQTCARRRSLVKRERRLRRDIQLNISSWLVHKVPELDGGVALKEVCGDRDQMKRVLSIGNEPQFGPFI